MEVLGASRWLEPKPSGTAMAAATTTAARIASLLITSPSQGVVSVCAIPLEADQEVRVVRRKLRPDGGLYRRRCRRPGANPSRSSGRHPAVAGAAQRFAAQGEAPSR